jgi:hypothetical protein
MDKPAYESDYTVLVFGYSGSGKSYSLRNLDVAKTAYINVEGKPLLIRNANDLAAYYKPTTIPEVQNAISECVKNDNIEYIVFDSITMLADKIMFPHFIKNAPVSKSGAKDTQTGWMNYKTFFNEMIAFCKASKKSFIFTALAMEINDEQDKFEKMLAPKIQGSLKESVASEFTTVLYATAKLEEVDGKKQGKFVFQTNREPNNWYVQAKSPPGALDTYMENDISIVLDKLKKYYK